MITALHQIEITSRCDLRCKYCVHPTMARAKQDMDEDTYRHCLDIAAYFVKKGTQKEVNLAGIGESTLHPQFLHFVELARKVCGPRAELILATNGLNIAKDPSIAAALVPFRPRVWVSVHRPERAAPAINALRDVGLLHGVSTDPALAAIDWAGQVKWTVTAPDIVCPWVGAQRVFVTSIGAVYSCCLDGRAYSDGMLVSDVFTVDGRALSELEVVPYSLCATCSYKLPKVAA